MNLKNVTDAVAFYRNMTIEGIDHLRGLTDDEVVATKAVIQITESPKRGRPRQRKTPEAQK
jgi:hypothetical protein